jgi:hypothetical protein
MNRKTLAAIAAFLVALGTLLGALVDDDQTTVVRTVSAAPAATAVDGPDADVLPDDALALGQPAQEILEEVQADDVAPELQDPLRESGDTPSGVLEDLPLATQEFPGCRTAFVRNYSSRGGVRPQVIVLHQTVSRERGQSSQNALTAYANSPSSGVSWHFLVGRTNGLCTYTVPLGLKAWTQGNANPFSIGIEVEAYGDEGTYVTGEGRAKLIAILRRLSKIYRIPLRPAVVRDCRVVQSGVGQHKDLDQSTTCAGGHHDVNLDGVAALIRDAAKDPCGKRCRQAKRLRAQHTRTHQLFRKNTCRGKTAPRHGYCNKLRARNKAIHTKARRARISLR